MDLRVMLGKVGQVGSPQAATSRSDPTNGRDFAATFQQALDRLPVSQGLRVTAHAATRLDERGLTLTDSVRDRLQNAMNELAAKGAKDSLVVLKEGAFVVNVPSRTLITALAPQDMRDRIVTKIDSVHLMEA
jgi:flagellar operon protein